MRGKSLFLFLGIVAALLTLALFTTLGIKKLSAAPTAPLIILTNIVLMDWNGGAGTAGDTNTTVGVGTNFGASWIGQNNANIQAGGMMSNITWLTNDGNLQGDFVLTYFSNYSGAANTGTKTWSCWFTNLNDGTSNAPFLGLTLSPAAVKQIHFMVSVPIDEGNALLRTFSLFASNSNATTSPVPSLNASNYTGLNGTVYGGTMGKYGIPFMTLMENSQASPNMTNWVLTVQAATMTVAKLAGIVNPVPFNANTTTPYPGAQITYRVQYQNTGAANANAVRIVDTMPTNYVAYVANSIKRDVFGAAIGGYGGYAGLTDVGGDDEGAWTAAALDQVIFTPGNNNSPTAGGIVAPAGSAAYFFRVTVK